MKQRENERKKKERKKERHHKIKYNDKGNGSQQGPYIEQKERTLIKAKKFGIKYQAWVQQ